MEMRCRSRSQRVWPTLPIAFTLLMLIIPLGRIQAASPKSVSSANGSNGGTVQHKVKRGETLWDIARKHNTSVEAVAKINKLSKPNFIREGQVLTIPTASNSANADERSRILLASRGRLSSRLAYPLRARISSGFGPRWGKQHEGVDFAAPTGTPIRAAAGGVVSYAGWSSGYGRLIILDHGNGVTTYYAHNSRILVDQGQRVAQGQIISELGATGDATGPNLHFEVRIDGKAYDPMLFFP